MLTVSEHDGVVVLSMSAPADVTAADAAEFDRAAQASSAGRRTVLDLSRVGFLDSAGVGSIVRLHRRLEAGGGELRLAAASGPVATILELVRLHRMIEVHDTVESAVTSFRDEGDGERR